MLEFSSMAQDFVEATSPLVGGRTINIMDTRGTIIASAEKERIGTFHQGAAEVIATGRPVLIGCDDLDRYQGAKEGYNMPIFLKDELIGVVGIFGCEEQMLHVANLLKVYVTQHFAQQALAQKQKMESEVRGQLLRLLLLGDISQAETISQLSALLPVQLVFPVKVILIRTGEEETAVTQLDHFSRFFHSLSLQGGLDRRLDVFGIQKNDYVIIHSSRKGTGGREAQAMDKLAAALMPEEGCRMTVSGPCERLCHIPNGMEEACTLMNLESGPLCCLDESRYRIQYLLYNSLIHGGSRHAEALYRRLTGIQAPAQAEVLLATAAVYYQENGSVQKASKRLHIHKNTLLYRMKRLFTLLDLEEETPFAKEFFIRLILTYHPVTVKN